MPSNKVTIPIACWGENTTLDLTFPEDWKITHCTMKGHDAPGVSDGEIRDALGHTYGTPPLREMARGRKRVAILFDDLIRPTPAYRVAPFVVEELHRAGISDDQIRFVAAIGTHAPMTREEFVKKLGEGIVERYPVYNHNIYDNVTEVGKTSFDTPVFINREVASCDLKIGIGGVLPYFGKWVHNGGGKIILPGVSGIETIYDYHITFYERMKDRPQDPRVVEGIPPYRVNLEEAARLAGLDMKVDLIQNNRREVAKVFAGDFIQTHRCASAYGRGHYTTPVAPPSDIVILNSYPKEDQPLCGLWLAVRSVKPGGDVVIVSHSTNGLSHTHYLFGRFGTDFGGRGWGPGRHFQIGEAGRVIFCSPYPTRYDMDNYKGDNVHFVKTWDETRALLEQGRSQPATVAVYPYGAIQMPEAD
jgi:nickel-dependent lactate racemase